MANSENEWNPGEAYKDMRFLLAYSDDYIISEDGTKTVR